ncbi:MAG: DUF1565 domain-containing protein, partial [Bacteroidetes bacterium]|nr:DUF1565 domain-containing protein [Bacteroidota bacterium]
SGGAGTWADDVYTPAAADIAAGSVVLTYTTNTAAPCGEVDDDMTVTFNPLPSLSPSYTPPVNHGEPLVINSNVTGGTAPYDFVWTGPGYSGIDENVTIDPASPSNTGTYYVTVIDANGCTATASVDVIVYGEEIYVNDAVDNGTELWCTDATGDDDNPGTTDAPLLTIMKAISVAIAGDKIRVDAGTYTEQVLVQKDLTLEGAGRNVTIVKASAGRTGTAPAFSAGSDFQADYIVAAYPVTLGTPISVKITGFTFDADNLAMVNGTRYPGVFFRQVSDVDIADAGLFNCEVKGFLNTDTETSGIWVEDKCNLTIHGNTFSDFNEFGTNVYGYAGYDAVVVATSDNTYNAGSAFASILYWYTTSGSIYHNTIDYGLNGIQIIEASNTSILKNKITNVKSGDISSVYACGWGISIQGSSSSNNTIGDDTPGNANEISAGEAGIVFFGTEADYTATGTGNTAIGNKIYDNEPWGLYNYNTTTAVVATHNWWGEPSGPTTSQNNPSTNPCGTGDKVSLNVTFTIARSRQLLTLPIHLM